MGKLPEFFFKPNGTANVNLRAQKIFQPVFILLSFVPTALIVFSIIQEFISYKALVLVAILAFSFYNGIVRRNTLLSPNKALINPA